MSEKKQLNEEQLEKVTGGSIGEDGLSDSGGFSGFLSMYALHDSKYFGQRFYFVHRNESNVLKWFCAKLVDSYEAWNWIGTNCTHKVEVTYGGNMGERVGRNWTFAGEEYAVYQYYFGEPAK